MVEFTTNAVSARLIQLRCEFSGPRGRSHFARALGISPSTYSYYEKNRMPPIPVLLKICRLCHCEMDWLLTGELSMTDKSPTNGTVGGDSGNLSQTLRTAMGEALESNPSAESALIAFSKLLKEKQDPETTADAQLDTCNRHDRSWIPVLGRTAAGMLHFWSDTIPTDGDQAVTELSQLIQEHTGADVLSMARGEMTVDLQLPELCRDLAGSRVSMVQLSGSEKPGGCDPLQFIECSRIHQLYPDAFALGVDGDSMSPRIDDGDIVIVSPSVPAMQGHAAVVKLKDQIGVTCKLIRTTKRNVHLIPINEKYQIKTVDSDLIEWSLAVLCHLRLGV